MSWHALAFWVVDRTDSDGKHLQAKTACFGVHLSGLGLEVLFFDSGGSI